MAGGKEVAGVWGGCIAGGPLYLVSFVFPTREGRGTSLPCRATRVDAGLVDLEKKKYIKLADATAKPKAATTSSSTYCSLLDAL